MATAIVQPVITCEKCSAPLQYVKQPDGRTLLWHWMSDCERSTQFYEVPVIELKRVFR